MIDRTCAATAAVLALLWTAGAALADVDGHHETGAMDDHMDGSTGDHMDGHMDDHMDGAGGHADMGLESGIGGPGNAADAGRTVEIILSDYYFEPDSLEVGAGETVRFVLRNEGGAVHEFNIGTAAAHRAHQDEMAMMVEHGVIETDHINYDMMGVDMGGGHVMTHDHANSALLEPGKSAEMVWTFPDGGHLEFACNIPGHYDAGMMGRITVAP